jgi:sugar lactone lactonase YvrE
MSQLKIIHDEPNILGESPLWHPQENKLYWTDIFAPAIYSYDPESKKVKTYTMPCKIFAIAYRQKGGLLATTEKGISFIDIPSGKLTDYVQILDTDSDLNMNDGKCDRQGRFWAGSADFDVNRCDGKLYRITPDGTVKQMEAGLSVSNGIGWSPDNSVMYHNDSLTARIFCYDFNSKEGTVSNQRIFHPLTEGSPDGLTVDSKGGVWMAFWDDAKVVRYLSDGTEDRVIELPTSRPTSVMIGGKDLTTLYITSCNYAPFWDEKPQPSPAGALFAIDIDVKGIPEPGFLG